MVKIVALCAGLSAEKASIMIKIVPQMKPLAVKRPPFGFPCICITLLLAIPRHVLPIFRILLKYMAVDCQFLEKCKFMDYALDSTGFCKNSKFKIFIWFGYQFVPM